MKKQQEKINVKKIVMIGLTSVAGLFLMIILGTCFWFFTSMMPYHNVKNNLQMYYPRGWAIKENPLENVLVMFISPKEDVIDSFHDNVNFSTYDMSKNLLSTEQYADIATGQINAIFPQVKVVQKQPFPVAGRQGYRLVMSDQDPNSKVIVLYLFTIQEMGYNIFYLTCKDHYPKDRLMLDAMALTMKVKY